MKEYIIAQQPAPESAPNPSPKLFLEPELIFLLALAGLGLGLSKIFVKPKGVLATAYWGGRIEKVNALRTTQKQRKEKKPTQIALLAGHKPADGLMPQLQTLLTGNLPSIPLPNLTSHAFVMGSTKTGKSQTLVIPALQDAIRSGIPLIVLDAGRELMPILAPYSRGFDYDIYSLAPGKDYTDCLNVFDCIKDEEDSIGAEQIGTTIVRNGGAAGASKADPFFGPSGERLVRSVLMLTKGSKYPDLTMAKRVISLSDLTKRLSAANQAGRLNPWVEDSFQQFLSGESSEKTIAGIAATAGLVFDSFTRKEFMNSFIGKSTIPLDFTGRKILFVQPTMGQEEVTMPLLVTAIERLIEHNFASPRSDPLLLCLDEFPIGYFPRSKTWMSVYRKFGLGVMLTAQNYAQIRERYGADGADTILSNARTQFYFDPNNSETAKMISERLGKKEVRYKQSSHSHGKGGSSNSQSEHIQVAPLKSAEEVELMREGEFIMKNKASAAWGKAGVPIHMKYTITDADIEFQKQLEQDWEHLTCPELVERVSRFHFPKSQLTQALVERKQAAEELLPLPEEAPSQPQSNSNTTAYGALSNERNNFAHYA